MSWHSLIWLISGFALGWWLCLRGQHTRSGQLHRADAPLCDDNQVVIAELGGAHAVRDLATYDDGLRKLSATTDRIEALQAHYERQRAPDQNGPRAGLSANDTGLDYQCRRLEYDARMMSMRIQHLQASLALDLRTASRQEPLARPELRCLLGEVRDLDRVVSVAGSRAHRIRASLLADASRAQAHRARQSLEKLASDHRQAQNQLDTLLARRQRHQSSGACHSETGRQSDHLRLMPDPDSSPPGLRTPSPVPEP